MIFRAADIRLAVIAFAGCAASALAQAPDQGSSEPQQAVDQMLLARALEVSPEDLGKAFLVNRYMIRMTEIVGGNVQVHTPEGTIDASSAAAQRKEFERRLAAYREAITQRGFENFAGEYRVSTVTPSCARSGSLLLGGAMQGIFEKYEIAQDSFEVTLTITLAGQPGETMDFGPLEIAGIAVESALVFEDPMNSDYFVEGKGSAGRVEIRPNTDVLKGWPQWAGPPKKRDLERCMLVLERQSMLEGP